MSPAASWEFVSLELARDHHVVTLDVRGRGASDRSPAGYGLDAYAADVAAVVRGLGLTRPVVVGHSMGGRIAAAVAARYRGLLAAVVVADPPLSGPGRPPYPFPLDVYTGALAAAQAGDFEALARYFPSPNNVDLARRAAWLRSCDQRAVVETYEKFHTEDFFTDWPHVPPPVLFVCGDGSPVVRSTEIPEIRAANPHAVVVVVRNAGHMIPRDNLVGFLDAVRQFLSASLPSVS